MTNETLKLIERIVFIFERIRLSQNSKYRYEEAVYENLRHEFIQQHKGNHTLIREVNDILDARSALAENQAKFRLLCGLQMGMELREIQLLPDEQELQRFIYAAAPGAFCTCKPGSPHEPSEAGRVGGGGARK